MIKYAILSLKKDYKQALFYWLIFVLTSFFIFSIFNLSLNENQLLSISGGVGFSLISFMLILVILVTMYASLSANHFYVSSKSKELAINLISGATFIQLLTFLMTQNLIIMVTSIPIGTLLGYISIPFQNYILTDLFKIDLVISFSMNSFYATVFMISFMVFWCMFLNFSYANSHTVSELLRQGKNLSLFKKRLIPDQAYAFMFFLGIILVVINGYELTNYFIFTLIGIIGLYGMNKYYIPRLLSKVIEVKASLDARALIYLNYLKTDMKKMNLPIMVLVLSTGLLISAMAFYYPSMETMVALLSYYMIIVLMSLSILLKYMGIIESRIKEYQHLTQFGFVRKQLKSIIIHEIFIFFTLLFLLSSIYSFLILFKLYLYHIMSLSFVSGIVLSTTGIFILMGLFSYFYYIFRLKKSIKQW